MDDDVLSLKLVSLGRCLSRIREKTPASAETLAGDLDLQDIIVLNLQRAVQLSVDIAARILANLDLSPPVTMAEGFDRLAEVGIVPFDLAARLRRSVGFRNIAVHEYESLNWQIVFRVISANLDDFTEFARAVAVWMEKSSGEESGI